MHFYAKLFAYFEKKLYLCNVKGRQEKRKEAIMLGFSANNGVEIKGRYARNMRMAAQRRETGVLNKHDRQVYNFLNEKPRITLVRE